jgi:voltage-gated potassium channel
MLSQPGTRHRRWEIASQLLVLYSIVTFYLEAEVVGPGELRAASGFWLWNERLVVTLFCLEYALRWALSRDRVRYPLTPLALVDLVAIAPAVAGLSMNLRTLRILRILPLLWMFKLYRYNRALQSMLAAFRKVQAELVVTGLAAAMVLVFSAVALHELERQAQPDKFGRLSDALWWSLVTMTTVGYGDCYPVTGLGRLVAGGTMIVGIGILGTFFSLLGSSLLAHMRAEGSRTGESTSDSLPHHPELPESAWPRRQAG